MRPTLPQLHQWNPVAWLNAAKAAEHNADTLGTSMEQCRRAFDAASDWDGATHAAARTKSGEERDHGHEIRGIVYLIADAAEDAFKAIDEIRHYTINRAADAVRAGFQVSPEGIVTHPDNTKRDEAAQRQGNIQGGLDQIARFDGEYGTKLRGLIEQLARIKTGQQDVTGPDGQRADPDDMVTRLAGMSPDARAAALARMSPADINQLVIANPSAMGSMNGVPFDTRIAANAINVRNALGDELRKTGGQETERVRQLRGMAGQQLIPGQTAPANDSQRRRNTGAAPSETDRKFVLFSNDGAGRTIEMVGNLDRGSKGVGVWVPGTNNGPMQAGDNFRARSMSAGAHAPIFVYTDGELPQGLTGNLDPRNGMPGTGGAPDPRFAKEMAPRLVDFGREIDREIAHHAPGAKVTYMGHSYGGAIVGTAEQLGLRADRVLHLSSAGTGIMDSGYRNPEPGVQRYSMTAPGDPIGQIQQRGPYHPLGNFPGVSDPDRLPGVTRLEMGDRLPNGERIHGWAGHTNYLAHPDSQAFKNIVAVISGAPVVAQEGPIREDPYIVVPVNGVDIPIPVQIPDLPELPRPTPTIPDGLPGIPGLPKLPKPGLPSWFPG